MHTSSNRASAGHYIVIISWLISVLVAAVFFMSERTVVYDPKGLLTGVANETLLNSILTVGNTGEINQRTLVHFSSDNCRCNEVSKKHINLVFDLAKENSFELVHVNVDKHMTSIIPSTPSVMLIDKSGDLIYLGPYGEGLTCSKTNGVVDTVLNNLKKGYKASTIYNDAKGCYCNLS